MNIFIRISKFVLAAIIVIVLGGFGGWYFYIHKSIKNTEAADDARGTGDAPSFGGSIGNTLGNLGFSFGKDAPRDEKNKAAPRLWQVSRSPAAGQGFASSGSKLYFAERATGNVLTADPTTSIVERLTNTLFPKTYEAFFAPDGSVILRSVSADGAITTYAATLGTTTPSVNATSTPETLKGVDFADGITAIVAYPPRQLGYLMLEKEGGVAVMTSDWGGGKQKTIAHVPLSNWRMSRTLDGKLVLTQKATDDVPGYAYVLAENGTLQPLIGNAPGLTTLARGGGVLIYGTSGGGAVALYARSSQTATSVKLPIQTTAEKCVWAPGPALIAYCAAAQSLSPVGYLLGLYRGAIHTADAWYEVDVSAGTATPIFSPEATLSLDVEDPVIDASGTYIAFRNAADKSLWMFRVDQ